MHWGILVNKAASRYDSKAVNKLIKAVKDSGGAYTVVEPGSANDLIEQAKRLSSESGSSVGPRRGSITGLIAAGGDGTVNLVGRAAIEAEIPIGILPLGKFNNIALSLFGPVSIDTAIARTLKGEYRLLDAGSAGGLMFFDAIGFGFVPHLVGYLATHRPPRFGLGWSQLGPRLAMEVRPEKFLLKVDSYRLDIAPLMLQINLLKYVAGIPISGSSITDDGEMEVIFDLAADPEAFGGYLKQVVKDSFLYGTSFRLYRGRVITCSPTQGKRLYLDGEIITVPASVLEISLSGKQLRVYC